MIVTAHPKINLGLDILSRREDGYHEIDTLMLPFRGVGDTLEVVPTIDGAIHFEAEGITLDCSSDRNLVVRAWMLLRSRYGIGGAHIRLDKQIPFGAGLGGGSADAAMTLVALNEVYSLGLTTSELEGLAAELGSDVPFFITSQPMFCRGRGEILCRRAVVCGEQTLLWDTHSGGLCRGYSTHSLHPTRRASALAPRGVAEGDCERL